MDRNGIGDQSWAQVQSVKSGFFPLGSGGDIMVSNSWLRGRELLLILSKNIYGALLWRYLAAAHRGRPVRKLRRLDCPNRNCT
jgi:hypothetical protein